MNVDAPPVISLKSLIHGRRRPALRGALLTMLAGLLGACSASMPMREVDGRALQELRRDPQAQVLVSMTHATLDPQADRRAFDRHTRQVFQSLNRQPGLLAYAGRTELLGDQVWTITVWRDRAARNAFMRAAAHTQAIDAGMSAVAKARFATFDWPAARLPLDWTTALALLEQHQREYDYSMKQ